MEYEEMRVLFLYEFKLGHSGAEAARRINKAFGAGTIEQRAVRRWYGKFRQNDFSFQNGSTRKSKKSTSAPGKAKGNNESLDANDTTEILNESVHVDVPFSNLKYVNKVYLYEYKMGRTELEAVKNINKAFGSNSVTQKTIKFWFDKFRKDAEPIFNGHAVPAIPKTHLTSSSDKPSKKLPKITPSKAKAVMAPVNKSLAKIQIKLKFFGKRKKDKDRQRLLKS